MTKTGTPLPQKKNDRSGTPIFADGDMHRLRQIDSKPKSAAFDELPHGSSQEFRVFLVVSEIKRANKSDQTRGVSMYVPLCDLLTRGCTPLPLHNFGKSFLP